MEEAFGVLRGIMAMAVVTFFPVLSVFIAYSKKSIDSRFLMEIFMGLSIIASALSIVRTFFYLNTSMAVLFLVGAVCFLVSLPVIKSRKLPSVRRWAINVCAMTFMGTVLVSHVGLYFYQDREKAELLYLEKYHSSRGQEIQNMPSESQPGGLVQEKKGCSDSTDSACYGRPSFFDIIHGANTGQSIMDLVFPYRTLYSDGIFRYYFYRSSASPFSDIDMLFNPVSTKACYTYQKDVFCVDGYLDGLVAEWSAKTMTAIIFINILSLIFMMLCQRIVFRIIEDSFRE